MLLNNFWHSAIINPCKKRDVDSNNHLYLLQYANPKPSLSRHYSRAISGSFVAMISLWFLNWLLSLVFTIRVGYSLVHSWSFLVAVGLCLVLIWHWIFLSILITVNRKYFPTALQNSKIHADINSSGKLRQINLFLIMSCMVLGLTATMFLTHELIAIGCQYWVWYITFCDCLVSVN